MTESIFILHLLQVEDHRDVSKKDRQATTKKKDCPASICIQQIAKFPDLQVKFALKITLKIMQQKY